MRRLPFISVLLVILLNMWGCKEDVRTYVANVTDPNTTPTMYTTDVETFISDSGYTRYRIVTPLWQMFDEADEPHWRFPEGLELQQYDRAMKPEAYIECDSARYFSDRRLWRLDGHVVMVNTLRDSFLTQQLYWDQLHRDVFSDSFIHIVRQDRIIEGYGFRSNQNMTSYTVTRPTAIIPAQRPGTATASAPAGSDSTATFIPGTSGRPSAPTRASERNTVPGMQSEQTLKQITPSRTQPR